MAPRRTRRTTSATRGKNKGKGQSKVTGKTPQSRANRQRTSTARVTRSGQGGGRGRVTNASQRTSTGRARVTGGSRAALPPGKKGGALAKTTKALPAGKTPKALPPGKAGGALARTGRGAGVGRVLVPVGMVAEVKAMVDRAKRDAERNKKLNRRPFEELRADRYKSNTKRSGQGGRKPKPKPADPQAVAKLTQPGGIFYRAPKNGGGGGGTSGVTSRTNKGGGGGGSSTTTSRRAAAPAPKPKPKKKASGVSGVGPVASGRTYSVRKTGKSVMQQQADELRAMRKRSVARQKADKAKLKKKK